MHSTRRYWMFMRPTFIGASLLNVKACRQNDRATELQSPYINDRTFNSDRTAQPINSSYIADSWLVKPECITQV